MSLYPSDSMLWDSGAHLKCSSLMQAFVSSHSHAMVLPSSEFLPHPFKASLELNRLSFQIVSLLKSPPAKLAFLGLESPRRIFFQLNLMTWDLWEQEMGAALSISWTATCIIFGIQCSAHPTLRSVILKAHCGPVFSSLSFPWFSLFSICTMLTLLFSWVSFLLRLPPKPPHRHGWIRACLVLWCWRLAWGDKNLHSYQCVCIWKQEVKPLVGFHEKWYLEIKLARKDF